MQRMTCGMAEYSAKLQHCRGWGLAKAGLGELTRRSKQVGTCRAVFTGVNREVINIHQYRKEVIVVRKIEIEYLFYLH